MPCLVRNRDGRWTRLLISEAKAVVFASATLNAIAAGRGGGLHTAVLYAADDEDAEAMLERLNESVDPLDGPNRGSMPPSNSRSGRRI